jgi:hypothetical protein
VWSGAVPLQLRVAFTQTMESALHQSDSRSTFGRVLESNECRLDALDRQGIRVDVDGPTVLEFLFDRALAFGTGRELRLNWVLNIAGWLNYIESEAHTRATPGVTRIAQ